MASTKVKNETVSPVKSGAEESAGPSAFTKARYSRKVRLWVIGLLLIVVAVLFFFFEKIRIYLAIVFVALLAAFGLEAFGKDYDLQQLWQTKSFEQSEVSRDEQGNIRLDEVGNILFDKLGNQTTDPSLGKSSDEYNCDDFDTQPEAQSFFLKVGGTGNDVNRLDGDKDGEACESLPATNR